MQCAVDVLIQAGVKPNKIIFLNLIAAPEGIKTFFERFPDIRVVTTEVDERLNERAFILPGIGDFGDRYFGTT
jgi:uracil phosphoribosyltransferase